MLSVNITKVSNVNLMKNVADAMMELDISNANIIQEACETLMQERNGVKEAIIGIYNMIYAADTVCSPGFKIGMQMAKLWCSKYPGNKITLSHTSASKLIKLLGECCYKSLTSTPLYSTEEWKLSMDVTVEAFRFFKISSKTWLKNVKHLVYIVIHRVVEEPEVAAVINELKKLPGMKEGLVKELHKIRIDHDMNDEIRVYITASVKARINELTDDNDVRERQAEQMAQLLLEEETIKKEKHTKKMNKVKDEQKIPRIDEDEGVFMEDECMICMTHPPDIVFDCGHCIVCSGCAPKVDRKCLYCTCK